MLRFLNKNIAFQWVLFLGLLILSIYNIITRTQLEGVQGAAFLYIKFSFLFSQHELLCKCIIIIVLLLQLWLMQYYYKKNEYASKTTLLPACFYLSILLLTKSLTAISPFFFSLFFFLIIICLDFAGTSVKLKNNVFWTGMLIALATCFDISSVILLILMIVTLVINQYSQIKEIGILLFGFGILYFYFFFYYFLTSNFKEWLFSFQEIKIMGVLNSNIANFPLLTLCSLVALCIIYIFFIVKFKLMSDVKVVKQRDRIVTLNTRAFLMVACIFISNSSYPNILGYLFVHISIYLAMLAQEKSPLYINELITIIMIAALWL